MNIKKGTVGIVVVLVTLGGLWFLFGQKEFGSESGEQKETQRTYSTVPAFSLSDYDGKIVTPDGFPGKVLVINSWATWCPFCVDELPHFAALQDEFADTIVVIAIDRGESQEVARQYTDSAGISDDLIFLIDQKDSFYQSIGGFSMPETIFVDREGNVRVHKRGPMTLEEMREKVEQILQ